MMTVEEPTPADAGIEPGPPQVPQAIAARLTELCIRIDEIAARDDGTEDEPGLFDDEDEDGAVPEGWSPDLESLREALEVRS